ncbi:MAG: hypothetical protein HUU50_03045 [Candidatus Brocadiae bacterium]|nr:hypothetical protein [Candidatus Brocadiia bacterium]
MAFGLICLIFVAGLAILFIELFVPGAILGFIGAAILISSIVLAFLHHPPAYGLVLIVITLIVVPSAIIWWLRKVSLGESQKVEDGYTSADETLEALLGKEGETITLLRPCGLAKIAGRRVDVTAENLVIQPNTPIKVVKVEGNRVVVVAHTC